MFFLHFTAQHCSGACRQVEFCYSAILILLFHDILEIGRTSFEQFRTSSRITELTNRTGQMQNSFP